MGKHRTQEIKDLAVAFYRKHGRKATCDQFGVEETALYRWLKKAGITSHLKARGNNFHTLEYLIESAKSHTGEGCLEWKGAFKKTGMRYGAVSINRRQYHVHRICYQYVVGDIPDGLVVRHTCDNPKCYNPKHLLLGTDRENTQDRIERDRSAKGEQNGNVRFTAQEALEIFRSEGSYSEIARRFQTTHQTIRFIKLGVQWNCVTGLPKRPQVLPKPCAEFSPSSRP